MFDALPVIRAAKLSPADKIDSCSPLDLIHRFSKSVHVRNLITLYLVTPLKSGLHTNKLTSEGNVIRRPVVAGTVPMMAYTGRLRPKNKGYLFSILRYLKVKAKGREIYYLRKEIW